MKGRFKGVNKKTDIAVIGGGASGLAAAIGAKTANSSAEVLVVEKLAKTGRKILAAGSGRCNLGNTEPAPRFYHGSVRNAAEIIAASSGSAEFFASLGVLTCADSQGRLYPVSSSGTSVLGALRLKNAELGAEELCGFGVTDFHKEKNGYRLISESGEISCRRIIIAAGGYAAPSFGTDGGMLRLLKEHGYKSAKICPGIAPLKVAPEAVKGLKGVRVKGKISAVTEGKILREEYGEIQFTENSLSGICVFNLAGLFSKYEGRLSLAADLLPDMTLQEVEDYLFSLRRIRKGSTADELLTGAFVRNLAVYLVKTTLGRQMTDRISMITDREIKQLAQRIKGLEFKVTGCSSWQNAQVTIGGIHGSCVDENLRSVRDGGIYFAGEILDIAGDCGGYNLEWAWASGLWAGKKCAESLKDNTAKPQG